MFSLPCTSNITALLHHCSHEHPPESWTGIQKRIQSSASAGSKAAAAAENRATAGNRAAAENRAAAVCYRVIQIVAVVSETMLTPASPRIMAWAAP